MEVNKPIASIIIVMLALMFAFLFLLPKYQEVSVLALALEQKQAEYNGKSVYYAQVADLLLNIESKSDALKKIESSLPQNLELAPLIYFFHQKGGQNGLVIKSIGFSRSSPANTSRVAAANKAVKDVVFSLDVAGTYQGIKGFLVALEKSSRLFSVQSLAFVSPEALQGQSKKGAPPKTYNVKMEIVTHTY